MPNTANVTNAYDYDAQKWVVGDAARAVRRSQLLEEISLLSSPKGAEYLHFLGSTDTVTDALKKASAELAAL
jgi:hypothetical protein